MTQINKPCPICGQETEGLKLDRFSIELKPCPYCGEDAAHLLTVPAESGVKFIAGCVVCGARTRECISHLDAIELWNTRPTDIPKKVVSKLRKMLDRQREFLNETAEELRATDPRLTVNLMTMAKQQEQALNEYLGTDLATEDKLNASARRMYRLLNQALGALPANNEELINDIAEILNYIESGED